MTTLDEAVNLAQRAKPSFLSEATAVAAYEDDASVIVAYQAPDDGELIRDLHVAVVDREARTARVVPFVAVFDLIDGMRDLTEE